MGTMYLLLGFVGCAGLLIAWFAFIALEQDGHRRAGLLPGPDPRTTTGALLQNVLGAVPVRRVCQGSVVFEDGSGILVEVPDRGALAMLSRLAADREVLLEQVHELTIGWRLVFGTGSTRALVDVDGFHVADTAPLPI